MHLHNSTFIYSATDVSNFLACPHLRALDRAAALGGPKPPVFDHPGTEVLRERGLDHEKAILEGYREQGLDVREPAQPQPGDGETSWADCARETRELMAAGADIIYQACLFGLPWNR